VCSGVRSGRYVDPTPGVLDGYATPQLGETNEKGVRVVPAVL